MRTLDGSTLLGVRATCASSLAVLLVAIGLLGPWASSPRAQAGQSGQWQTLPYTMPINPIHMALLHNGKVLVVAGSGNLATETNWRAAVLDLQLGQVVTQQVPYDMFCNGMVTLADGRVLINGGNLKYDPFWGEPRSAVYDPATGTFADIETMAHGRWYPTPTVLGDGRVMTFSGLRETGGTNTAVEIYTPGEGWSPEYPAGWTPPLYPRMHLLPNGNVFYAGSGRGSRIFNTTTNTWSAVIATTSHTSNRSYGTSVLLPLSPADNYRGRVMIFGGGGTPTATTEIIEPLAAGPAWAFGPPMSQARIQLNATILPSGRILVTGGSRVDENPAEASLNADLYNPATNSFSSASANLFARLYHSNALLLPDARVLLAGGNPERGTYEARMEVYSPAYLFNADSTLAQRPTITDVPAGAIDYGSSFQVQTPDAASIGSVVLIRPGTPTHAFDMDQRMVRLSFTPGTGTLDVVAPPNGNIAPPGYYMLFVLNSAGVPSVARFVRLGLSGPPPPPAPTALGATAVSASRIDLTWSDNAANETGFVIERCQGAGCSTFVALDTVGANTTSYSNTGLAASTSYSYRVAASNGAGTSGYSNTASATTPGTTPAAPSSLVASAVSASQINLTWSDNAANETGFVIERCQGAGCSNFATLAPVGANTTSYSNTGLAASTSYSYRVAATNGAGSSPYSNTTSATTSGTIPAGSATFVRADTTTQGNWISTYGNNGYLIATEIPSIPAYAQVSVIGAATHIWDFPSHVSALQRPGGTGRIASQFYSTTFFTYDVQLTDGQPHWIALYFLDWDSGGIRAQTVDVVDASTNTPLDSQFVANFTGGVYLVWEVSGHVQIRVTKDPNVGVNATVSGVFFDPASDPPSIPAAPSSLTAAAASASQINLTWTDNASNETGYVVERCQGAGCSTFTAVATLGANVTSYNNTGLAASTSYSYRVAASNGAGTSPYSNTASATTQGTTPAAPSGLNASAASASQINLTWTDNASNETGYMVERCQGAGCSTFTAVATLGANVTSYNNTGLAASTSYSYRVAASNGAGTSGYSNTASATTQGTTPAAPSGLNASAASASQINVTWSDNAANETGFVIERCQGAGCSNFAAVGTVGANTTSYSNTGLAASTSYSYRVAATNSAGTSGYSNTASATTQAASGLQLAVRGYKVKGMQHADLTWSGATSVNVDVYRNNTLSITTSNDGVHTDAINNKGGGSYTYRVCEAGTSTCSNDVTITF